MRLFARAPISAANATQKLRLAAGLLFVCGLVPGAHAATWDMPTPYLDNNYQTENVRWFVDEVAKATDGALKIKVHSGSSMYKMAEIKRALRTGQVPIAEFFLSAYGNEDPIYEADSVPFLAVGENEAAKLYQIQKPLIAKRFAKEGLVPLYSVIWPGNGLYSQQPINHVTDLKGVKIRGQTPIVARLAELCGAVPVNVQFVEVPQAFSTGVVTAMFSAASNGIEIKMWENTKYFSDLLAYLPRNVVAVNAKAWNALPADVRQKVEAVARQAEERGWQRAIKLQKEAPVALAANGMTVQKPSPELMGEFKKIGDQMIAEWVRRAGPEGIEIVKKMGK